MTNTAASISAQLRRLGFSPIGSGSNREGLKVKGGVTGVAIIADLDHPAEAARLSTDVEAALVDAGRSVRRSNDHIVYVG